MTKIAIFSDSHDNIRHLDIALTEARAQGAEMLLHCGDLCAPFIIKQMAEGFAGPIHIVFGNNDGDGQMLQLVASQYDHVNLHGIYVELAFRGRNIAMIHYPEPALRIAQSGQFDLVCYGHNHMQKGETLGPTHLINPGDIFGKDDPSWALYDAAAHTYQFFVIQ